MGLELHRLSLDSCRFLSPPLKFRQTHTLLISILGSGLIIATLLHFILYRFKHARQILIVIVTLAFVMLIRGALGSHAGYLTVVNNGQQNVETFVRNAPAFKEDTVFFIFMRARPGGWEKTLFGPGLNNIWRDLSVLQYVYNRDYISLCLYYQNSNEIQGCEIEDGMIRVEIDPKENQTFENVVAFQLDPITLNLYMLQELPPQLFDLDSTLYNPFDRIKYCLEPDSRIDEIFGLDLKDVLK